MQLLPFNRIETEAAATYALFGKLPNRADFVRVNASHPAALEFDSLIQRTLERWSGDSAWAAGYEATDAVDFHYVSRDRRFTLVGVVAPSRDQAGRRYPLTAAAILPSAAVEGHHPLSPIVYEVFFDGLREQVGNALENSVEALACRQFLESHLNCREDSAADLELAGNVIGRFLETRPARRLDDLLVAGEPPARLHQALLNVGFYQAYLRRFDHPATNQIVLLPLSRNKGEQALVASTWLSILAALWFGGEPGGTWRGSYLLLRRPGEETRLAASVGRLPDQFSSVMLGGAPDPAMVLDLAGEHEAWMSHRLYAEVSYALGRLLADPECSLGQLVGFLGEVGRQLAAGV